MIIKLYTKQIKFKMTNKNVNMKFNELFLKLRENFVLNMDRMEEPMWPAACATDSQLYAWRGLSSGHNCDIVTLQWSCL